MQQHRNSGGRVKLGELLVKAGVITESQLRAALQEQRQYGGKLGDILVRMRYMSEDVFVRALSKQLSLPRADLSGHVPVPPEAIARVPAELAEEYEIVPCALLDEGRTLAIATSDPLNLMVVDAVAAVARCRVVAQVAGASQIRAAIARYYGEETPQADPMQLRIVGNAEDVQVPPNAVHRGQAISVPPPVSQPPPFVHTSHAMAPTPVPGTPVPPVMTPVMPPVMPLAMPVGADAGSTNPQLHAALQPAPAYGYGYSGYSSLPPVVAGLPPAPPLPPPGHEEAQRREAAAIKALVELLVQKGVITLDEYLARLRR